jgi:hypothetical protein
VIKIEEEEFGKGVDPRVQAEGGRGRCLVLEIKWMRISRVILWLVDGWMVVLSLLEAEGLLIRRILLLLPLQTIAAKVLISCWQIIIQRDLSPGDEEKAPKQRIPIITTITGWEQSSHSADLQ